MTDSSRLQKPIAVVGVSALFPGSSDARGFWRDILAGRDLITDVPPSHWLIEDYYDPDPSAPDKTYAKRGAFLSPVDFDPLQFGVPPSIVPATDTAQLLALIVAQQVLDDAAQGQFASMDRERISVILGVTSAQELLGSMVSRLQRPVWTKALRESGIPEAEVTEICDRIAKNYVPWQESSFPGLLGNVVAGRIANRFDLRGTNAVTDAACASALAALSMAVHELALGESDLAITGGVDTLNDIFMYMCFSKTPALSPTGDCRPFSDGADGTMLGEGMGMLALKRLEDAERDGDRVYAVIRSVGSASDGRSKSVYAPVPEGQARALRRAYEGAGYGPETVELVEAHGTGTKAGDAAEFEGLRMTFEGSGKKERQWCALGSVKSQIGHTKAAAGAAGLFKAVMALHHKTLPPTIKITQPNPKLEIAASPFYLNTQTRPWIRDASHPRRASVSSFGFGGSNFHVALEEYTPKGRGELAFRLRSTPSELVLFGADSKHALAALCHAAMADVEDLGKIARRTQLAFSSLAPVRLAVLATSSEDLAHKLEQAAKSLSSSSADSFDAPSGVYWSQARHEGELAYLFPGQGSQYLGMGADVAMAFDQARAVWDHAASTRFDGAALHDVVFPRPVFSDAEREAQTRALTATEWAQPALGLTSLALVDVLRAVGVSPSCVAGHSFGEFTALCVAGAMNHDELLRVARRRGELMRDASTTPGAMTAVSCRIEDLRDLLSSAGTDVCIANHNAPTQVVLSGSVAGIESIERALASAGISTKRLPVATAFHSSLVAPSSAPLREYLDGVDIKSTSIDVYSNAEATPYPREPAAMRAQLAAQLATSVRFVDQIEAMYARGVRTFVEVGAGSVLSELVARILTDRPHQAISLDRKGRHGVTSVQHALARLSVAGYAIDFAPLWAPYAVPSETPKPKPKMTLTLNGSNYGKPYPPPGGAESLPAPNPARAAQPQTAPVPAIVQQSSTPLPTPAAMTTTSSEVHLAWVHAFQDAQRQTAEAHAALQRSMADSHAAFLRTAEASFAGLTSILTGAVAPPGPNLPFASVPAPVASAAPVATPMAPVAAAAPLSATTIPARPAGVDLEKLMLEVVAEKTGYPAEMLALTMDLEADLGVDSIKRVEILALMRERAPGLGEVKPAELATLRTLGQIVDYMRAQGGVTEAPIATQAAPAPSASNTLAIDLEKLMLEVVAEKTGYPAEMLALTMDLEADLGVDSIKRVEILALMRERAPGLGEVKPAELATLRTLGQIVDYMRAQAPGQTTAPAKDASATQTSVRANQPLSRIAVREVPAVAVGMGLAGISTGSHIVVTNDGGGVAAALVRKLAERGVSAVVVDAVPSDADVVLFLGGLTDVASIDEAIAINRKGFTAAKSVSTRFGKQGGAFVSVQDTGGDFGLSGSEGTRAWLGGLSALVRTAALEWPKAALKTLDIARAGRNAEVIADAIVTELFSGGATLEVGLHADGTRTTLRSVPVSVEAASASRITPQSVIVAAGGARGVTAATLIALARAHQPRIVLLGRTDLSDEPASCHGILDEAGLKRALMQDAQRSNRKASPAEIGASVASVLANREVRTTLTALETAGSRAYYLPVDVQNAAALNTALHGVRRDLGPITGIVHGAGVLADKRLEDKTQEQFDRVFDTKVLGLRALLDATKDDPIEVLALFSSIAARTGNVGQSDYAMANEVLNLVANTERARRGASCVVRAIGWGPWEGGMVTPTLAEHFKQRGVPMIPIEAGARAFVAELDAGSSDTQIVIGSELGDGALGAALTPSINLEARVDAKSNPELRDHTVAGVPVLPVVMALEWFARTARACRPDLTLCSIESLKVLRGIKLDRYERGGDTFVVRCAQLSSGPITTLSLELRGRGDALHYTATATLRAQAEAAPVSTALPQLEHKGPAKIYDGYTLFHGKAFQVIRAIEGVSREGIVGTLSGTRDRGWASASLATDPAALDGALQLAVLWTSHVLGGASLPMAIGSFHSYAPGAYDGPVRCIVRAKQAHDSRAVCDLMLVREDGKVVSELRGIETVLRPEQPSAVETRRV